MNFLLAPVFATSSLMTQLVAASWETIYHRTLLMALGTCTVEEYQAMVTEKLAAMQLSAFALMTGCSQEEVVEPYLSRAGANARRLREGI